MSVKISGTDGIDVAQLRAPDGDPVALTIDALGKLGFPAQGQLISQNGYVKLPGGLIVQWGYGGQEADGSVVVTFPAAFPAGPLSVTATPFTAPGGWGFVTVVDIQVANFTVESRSGAGTLAQIDFFWIALGR